MLEVLIFDQKSPYSASMANFTPVMPAADKPRKSSPKADASRALRATQGAAGICFLTSNF